MDCSGDVRGISARLLALRKPSLEELGAELSSARILDIILPADVRRAYAQALTAQKMGRGVRACAGETAALRSLANAARTIQEHPGLTQLRAVQAIEASKGNTPLELKVKDPQGQLFSSQVVAHRKPSEASYVDSTDVDEM